MTLLRTISRIEKGCNIRFPGNIVRMAGLEEGQLVEMKIIGAERGKRILITPKKSPGPKTGKTSRRGSRR